jgi:hypothetical protein
MALAIEPLHPDIITVFSIRFLAWFGLFFPLLILTAPQTCDVASFRSPVIFYSAMTPTNKYGLFYD